MYIVSTILSVCNRSKEQQDQAYTDWIRTIRQMKSWTFVQWHCWLQVPTSCRDSVSTCNSSGLLSLLGRGWYSKPRASSVVVTVLVEVVVERTGGEKMDSAEFGELTVDDSREGIMELFKNTDLGLNTEKKHTRGMKEERVGKMKQITMRVLTGRIFIVLDCMPTSIFDYWLLIKSYCHSDMSQWYRKHCLHTLLKLQYWTTNLSADLSPLSWSNSSGGGGGGKSSSSSIGWDADRSFWR